MPPRQRYYDPIVEGGEPDAATLPTVRALDIPLEGRWLYALDVVEMLRAYAEVVAEPDVRAVLIQLADIWDTSTSPPQEPQGEVERIELYPDPTGKWIARSVDTKGRVIEWLEGDFNIRNVETQCGERWPGIQIYQLQNESEDSTWDRMGPSPRLWRQN